MRILRNVGVWAGALLLFGSTAWSQQMPCSFPPCMTAATNQRSGTSQGSQTQTPMSQQPISQQPISTTVTGDTPLEPKIEQEQAKLRNTDRQRKLIEDTQKLLNLANELKADVDKSNKDMLSLDVIKKADEIEKLAHSVKEKMKGT